MNTPRKTRRVLSVFLCVALLLGAVASAAFGTPAVREREAAERAASPLTAPPPLGNRPLTPAELSSWMAHYHATNGKSEVERAVVRYTNIERARVGAPPLDICPLLSMAARFKSQEMVDLRYFAHESPVYGPFWVIPQMFGADHIQGENLARRLVRPNVAQDLVQLWMDSPGHRANMLDPRHQSMGAGVITARGVGVNFDGTPILDRYASMATQMFGGRAAASNHPFTDVNRGDWFYPAVDFVYSYGIMIGTSPTAFSPHMNLSRAMVATILWRMEALVEGPPNVVYRPVFSDVPPGEWYSVPVTWAFEMGIVDGVGGGRFAPHDPITREQLAVMMHRYELTWPDNTIIPGHFPVPPGVSAWARDAMRWASFHGFIDPSNPGAPASRAETAAFVYRYLLHYF